MEARSLAPNLGRFSLQGRGRRGGRVGRGALCRVIVFLARVYSGNVVDFLWVTRSAGGVWGVCVWVPGLGP